MKQKYQGDMDFMNLLDEEDRETFQEKTKEAKERAITENKLAKEEKELMENNQGVNQLVDRIASKSFQG
ncbi:MAG: hypothetical protein Q4D32_04885 [Eubacteriales bacterium]|nr:hypothetical protein [Eubacteriales bacterium]